MILISCAPGKKIQNNDLSFSFDQVNIGKDQTGIIGTIEKISHTEKEIGISVLVHSSKQGGSTSPAVGKGSKIELVATPIFRRQYKEKMGQDLSEVLSENKKALIVISQNQLKKTYILTHIVL